MLYLKYMHNQQYINDLKYIQGSTAWFGTCWPDVDAKHSRDNFDFTERNPLQEDKLKEKLEDIYVEVEKRLRAVFSSRADVTDLVRTLADQMRDAMSGGFSVLTEALKKT